MAEAIIKALGRFLARTVIYVIGGMAVIVTFLYAFNRLPTKPIPAPYVVFALGISYPIGYSIKELFVFARITTIAHAFTPCCCLKWLYRGYYGVKNASDSTNGTDVEGVKTFEFLIKLITPGRGLEYLDHIGDLRHAGLVFGPCGAVCAAWLFYRAQWVSHRPFDWCLFAMVLLLAIVFLTMSWIIALHHVKFMEYLNQPAPAPAP